MAINMGTNFLFVNGISYIANLVALVLQLALSLDYSIILCTAIWKKGITAKTQNRNGYRTYERAARDSVKFPYDGGGACRAYVDDAVNRRGNRIVACKRYRRLDGDGHILYAGSSRDFRQTHSKTRHKSFVPNVTKPARAIVKARKVIVPAFLLIAILAGVAQGFNKYSFNYNSGSLIVAPKRSSKKRASVRLTRLSWLCRKATPKRTPTCEIRGVFRPYRQIADDRTVDNQRVFFHRRGFFGNAVSYRRGVEKDIGDLIDKIPSDAGVSPLIIKPIIEGWFDDYVKNICPKVPNQAKPKSDLLICWILPSAKSSTRFPGL